MSASTIALRPYSQEDFLSDATLQRADETVVEILTGMLGLKIQVVEDPVIAYTTESVERTAIVGFSGSLRGSCEIQMTSAAVQTLATAMMGESTGEQPDDMLDDIIGEVCNMIGGGWKNRLPQCVSTCILSPPTVISGRNYKVRMAKPSARVTRIYRFAGHHLCMSLHREDISDAK